MLAASVVHREDLMLMDVVQGIIGVGLSHTGGCVVDE